MTKPFDPYNIDFNGHKLDPYRVIEIFQITHPAMQQVLKKVLRQGSKHKDEEQDARDIITSAQRFLDMKTEERRWKTEPELPFAETSGDGTGQALPKCDCLACVVGEPCGRAKDFQPRQP